MALSARFHPLKDALCSVPHTNTGTCSVPAHPQQPGPSPLDACQSWLPQVGGGQLRLIVVHQLLLSAQQQLPTAAAVNRHTATLKEAWAAVGSASAPAIDWTARSSVHMHMAQHTHACAELNRAPPAVTALSAAAAGSKGRALVSVSDKTGLAELAKVGCLFFSMKGKGESV